MTQLTKTPHELHNETIKDFSITNAVVMIVLIILFMVATTYVLISSLQ